MAGITECKPDKQDNKNYDNWSSVKYLTSHILTKDELTNLSAELRLQSGLQLTCKEVSMLEVEDASDIVQKQA